MAHLFSHESFMNFAHLANFQAIEFMDQPILKMLNILYVR